MIRIVSYKKLKIFNCMKYILVCGGVISGVGKGVVASSIGRVLKEEGQGVTIVKIDPYLNYDAGTLGPRDHGEVFVLDDGAETDLDLGNYERFLGVNLTKLNTITSGRMYQEVLGKERNGDYLGKTVQVVPHLTDHIKASILEASLVPVDENKQVPNVCIVELGGVVGDIESITFIEALRQLMVEVGRQNLMIVGVEYALELNEEHKTKPIQASAKKARELGIPYDVVVCRSQRKISEEALEKIALFTAVEKIIELPDGNVLDVPMELRRAGLLEYTNKRLDLPKRSEHPEKGLYFKSIVSKKVRTCRIAIVGKYSNHEDAYLSIKESLKFAGSHGKLCVEVETEYLDSSLFQDRENLKNLSSFCGIIIPGGFGKRGMEEMIEVAKYARENKLPLLGICLGMQIIVLEHARNVLGIYNATSEEVVQEEAHALADGNISAGRLLYNRIDHSFVIAKHSGCMRIGKQETKTVKGTKLSEIYGSSDGSTISERFRHRYGVAEDFIQDLERTGLKVGINMGNYVDGLEGEDHPFYIGVQFHPEFLSKPFNPRPIFISFLSACLKDKRK